MSILMGGIIYIISFPPRVIVENIIPRNVIINRGRPRLIIIFRGMVYSTIIQVGNVIFILLYQTEH